jgi:hypothetical protein
MPKWRRKAASIVKKSGLGAIILILHQIDSLIRSPGWPLGKSSDYQFTGADLTAGGDLPIFPRDVGRRFRPKAAAGSVKTSGRS